MKHIVGLSFVLLLIGQACSSPEDSSAAAEHSPTVDSTALAYIQQLPTVLLPYHWNEIALQNTDYRQMRPLSPSLASQWLATIDTQATYYGVAHVFDTTQATAIVVLESYLDTLFNVSDRYYLLTFDTLAQPVDRIPFAANIVGDKHTKLTGHLFPNGNVTTEKFTYTFTDGQWVRSDHAVKSVYYQIQPDGTIEEVHSEVDLDEENEDNNIVSEMLPLPAARRTL